MVEGCMAQASAFSFWIFLVETSSVRIWFWGRLGLWGLDTST